MERLRTAIADAAGNERLAAIFYLDLDRFKHVNDSLGHDVGDKLLKLVAQRLGDIITSSDMVSRFGGDEFTLLLPNIKHVDDATRVAQRITDCFMQPFRVAERELFATPSIGITLFPLDASDAESLIMNADVAMYHAKSRGGGTFQFYTSEMTVRPAAPGD